MKPTKTTGPALLQKWTPDEYKDTPDGLYIKSCAYNATLDGINPGDLLCE